MTKQQQVNKLMKRAFSLLRSHRYGDALAAGRKLKRLRHSSSFEIMALAYLRLGALPKAISTLEEGVAKAGRVWLLWELLGNCYSDAGRYNRAEKAYEQALRRPNCDRDVIHLNRAIAFDRVGKLKDAWLAVQKVISPNLRRRADEVRIRVSHALGHKRMAARLALSVCRRRVPVEGLDPQSESSILTACARALKFAAKTRRRARSLAYRAVGFNPANTRALEIIRELENHRSPNSSMFNLLIHGIWNEPFGKGKAPPGFFRSCHVYARDEAAALRYAKPFFPREVRSSLKVDESIVVSSNHLDFEGVYSLTSLIFYRRTSKCRAGSTHSEQHVVRRPSLSKNVPK